MSWLIPNRGKEANSSNMSSKRIRPNPPFFADMNWRNAGNPIMPNVVDDANEQEKPRLVARKANLRDAVDQQKQFKNLVGSYTYYNNSAGFISVANDRSLTITSTITNSADVLIMPELMSSWYFDNSLDDSNRWPSGSYFDNSTALKTGANYFHTSYLDKDRSTDKVFVVVDRMTNKSGGTITIAALASFRYVANQLIEL